MGIISTLKSVLGVGSQRGADRDRGSAVAVEREPTVSDGEPEAAAERAVKGIDGGPAEAVTGVDEPSSADDTPTDDASSTDDTLTDDGEPVDVIKGIGSAYAQRLADAGVDTVDDLAAADADDLADETGLGAGRIEGWIDLAQARRE